MKHVNIFTFIVYCVLLFATPFNRFAYFFVLLILLIIWLFSSFSIDRKWLKGNQWYILFLLFVILSDSLLSISNNDSMVVKQSLAGKIPGYMGFLFFLFYIRNPKLFKPCIPVIFVSLLITSAYTFWGNLSFPGASRSLADPSQRENSIYRQMNIGGYEMIYSLVLMSLSLILTVKYRLYSSFKSFAIIIALVFFFSTSVLASYFIGISIFILSILISFINVKNGKKMIFTILLISITFFYSREYIFSGLMEIGYNIDSYMLSSHAQEVLEGNYGERYSDEGNRLFLYRNAVYNFFESPIVGQMFGPIGHLKKAGHSELLEYLGLYGLFGFIYYYALIKIYRKTKRFFKTLEMQIYYRLYFAIVVIFFFLDIFSFAPQILFVTLFFTPFVFIQLDDLRYKNLI